MTEAATPDASAMSVIEAPEYPRSANTRAAPLRISARRRAADSRRRTSGRPAAFAGMPGTPPLPSDPAIAASSLTRSVGRGEMLAPARQQRLPAEHGLGVIIDGTWHPGHQVHRIRATKQPAQPDRHLARRRGAEHPGVCGEPVRHRRRLVIDDVVDALGVLLDGGDGGTGSVVDVNKGEN